MSGRILTREEFIAALDAQLAKERADSIARFDHGAELYGECDLTGRDWIQEAYEERLDERVYALFDEIREERNLPCPIPPLPLVSSR